MEHLVYIASFKVTNILVIFIFESKKKVVVIKGAMSTNAYENVSPGVLFKSNSQSTIYEF